MEINLDLCRQYFPNLHWEKAEAWGDRYAAIGMFPEGYPLTGSRITVLGVEGDANVFADFKTPKSLFGRSLTVETDIEGLPLEDALNSLKTQLKSLADSMVLLTGDRVGQDES